MIQSIFKALKTTGEILGRRVARRTAISFLFTVFLAQLLYLGFNYNKAPAPASNLFPLAHTGKPALKFFFYGEPGENLLIRPMAVTHAHGRLYVSDAGGQRIMVFNQDGSFVRAIGEPGDGPGRFLFPYGLAVYEDTLFVADLYTGKISMFDQNGVFKAYFTSSLPANDMLCPAALAAYDGLLYVTDVRRSRVYVFDVLTGSLVREIGMEDDISAPNGVAVDKNGYVYVTSALRQYIAVYCPEGRPVRLINGSDDGHGKSSLLAPRGIAISYDNLVYVTSQLTHEVMVFNQLGTLLYRFGKVDSEEGSLFFPNGLALDSSGRLFVVDTGNRRVAVLASSTRGIDPKVKASQLNTQENAWRFPPDDAAIYQVAERYVSALVADGREEVLSLLTSPHRQEWRADSFLLRPGTKDLYPEIKLAGLRHSFVRYSQVQDGDQNNKYAWLVVEYSISLSNNQGSKVIPLREELVFCLEEESWRIASSKRDIL